jgi:hypothetical protein
MCRFYRKGTGVHSEVFVLRRMVTDPALNQHICDWPQADNDQGRSGESWATRTYLPITVTID